MFVYRPCVCVCVKGFRLPLPGFPPLSSCAPISQSTTSHSRSSENAEGGESVPTNARVERRLY
ncbi:Uncharacterized protein APZ42_018437 [Daphnia magna]|uniref:Uncharacterized protein n=1 Tax=Daphnia magna TaxID=35525 RepID=A0A164Z6Y8_9CRUS|nr:Uncharacterized protein APZ42_018437 [Daphnia magna]